MLKQKQNKMSKSTISEQLTTRELAIANELYNQYKENKREFVKKYGADASKVMKGRSIKLAKSMADTENKQKIKEMIKAALTKGPVEEIDSASFVQSQKPTAPVSIPDKKEKNPIDVIMVDVPLMIRLLEYAREDAKEDVDLHDITEKAITLGKERGILQMDDYNEIVGAAEDIKETETPIGMLNRLNPNKSLKVGDITTFSSGKYKGKKVKIVKDLGDGRFELEIVGAAEDTPIQEMIKSVLNGKGIKQKK